MYTETDIEPPRGIETRTAQCRLEAGFAERDPGVLPGGAFTQGDHARVLRKEIRQRARERRVAEAGAEVQRDAQAATGSRVATGMPTQVTVGQDGFAGADVDAAARRRHALGAHHGQRARVVEALHAAADPGDVEQGAGRADHRTARGLQADVAAGQEVAGAQSRGVEKGPVGAPRGERGAVQQPQAFVAETDLVAGVAEFEREAAGGRIERTVDDDAVACDEMDVAADLGGEAGTPADDNRRPRIGLQVEPAFGIEAQMRCRPGLERE